MVLRCYGTLGAGVRGLNYRSSAQAEGQCGLMAKKVTVTLVDDFDGEGAADETVEFGLDGVSYEIDLSSKNAAKLRNDLKQWVDAEPPGWRSSARAFGWIGSRTGARSTANKARQSANGPAATGTTCPLAAASRPTSSTHSTRQRNRQLPELRASSMGSLYCASLAANSSPPGPGKRFVPPAALLVSSAGTTGAAPSASPDVSAREQTAARQRGEPPIRVDGGYAGAACRARHRPI